MKMEDQKLVSDRKEARSSFFLGGKTKKQQQQEKEEEEEEEEVVVVVVEALIGAELEEEDLASDEDGRLETSF